jgi:phosphoribosylamine--glycine ligase
MLRGSAFGDAGRTVVVEEFLTGIEASVFALTDGTRFLTLPPAQDHKRILDNDLGKNTGGMGAYAPTPYVTTEQLGEVKIRIIKPVLDGMRAEGLPYTGVLYTGLMLTEEGPRVLEFNCRFGDPETQVVLPLVDGDLADVMLQIAHGHLDARQLALRDATAVCVVMASNGYPDAYETGKPIAGLDGIGDAEVDVLVFHAGTRRSGRQLVTAGGRVLGVTAVGEGADFSATIAHAYNAVHRICFDGAYYRTDIARRALKP